MNPKIIVDYKKAAPNTKPPNGFSSIKIKSALTRTVFLHQFIVKAQNTSFNKHTAKEYESRNFPSTRGPRQVLHRLRVLHT